MVFNRASLVSDISKHFTLKPRDIIFPRTPEGVISGHPKEKQVWLKQGKREVAADLGGLASRLLRGPCLLLSVPRGRRACRGLEHLVESREVPEPDELRDLRDREARRTEQLPRAGDA